MAWGINQIEIVGLAIFRLVMQRGGLGFDGDPALALDIHGVQNLRGHFTIGQAPAAMDQAIRQGGLAMVDVGDNRKIADMLHNT